MRNLVEYPSDSVSGTCKQIQLLLRFKTFYSLSHTHTHTYTQEYDNDAESLISGISITPEDDDLDKALKLAHVDMYRKKVAERERRKVCVLPVCLLLYTAESYM